MSTYESASGLVKRSTPAAVLPKQLTRVYQAANSTSFTANIALASTSNAITIASIANVFPYSPLLLTANGANTPAVLPDAVNLIPLLKAAGLGLGEAISVKLMSDGATANAIYLSNSGNGTTVIKSGNIVLPAGTARDVLFVYANANGVNVY